MNGIWHGSASETKVYHRIPQNGTIDIYQHLLKSYGAQTVDVRTGMQWVVHISTDDSDRGPPPLVQIFKNVACRLVKMCS